MKRLNTSEEMGLVSIACTNGVKEEMLIFMSQKHQSMMALIPTKQVRESTPYFRNLH